MGCQRKIAQQVIDQGGDYVLALKGNQETVHDDVRRFRDDPATPLARATDIDKGIAASRPARRRDVRYRLAARKSRWPGLKAIGKITTSREINGKTAAETRCYLLSQAVAPERFKAIVGSHVGIENGHHWVLAVVMDEDQARNCKDHGPHNLALRRKLAQNLAKLEPSKGSMRGKLKRAGWDNAFLTQILLQFANIQMRQP